MNAFEKARQKTEARLAKIARQEEARAVTPEVTPEVLPDPVVVPKEKAPRDLFVDVTVSHPLGSYAFRLTKRGILSHVPAHRITKDEMLKTIREALQKIVGAVD